MGLQLSQGQLGLQWLFLCWLFFWAGEGNIAEHVASCYMISTLTQQLNINCIIRYFTGNTKNPDGSVQFVRGETKLGDAVDDCIKIVTIAVSAVNGWQLFFRYVNCH